MCVGGGERLAGWFFLKQLESLTEWDKAKVDEQNMAFGAVFVCFLSRKSKREEGDSDG